MKTEKEMSDNAYYTVVVISVCTLLITIAVLLTVQNIRITETALKHGYVEEQNVGTSGTHWTKE